MHARGMLADHLSKDRFPFLTLNRGKSNLVAEGDISGPLSNFTVHTGYNKKQDLWRGFVY